MRYWKVGFVAALGLQLGVGCGGSQSSGDDDGTGGRSVSGSTSTAGASSGGAAGNSPGTGGKGGSRQGGGSGAGAAAGASTTPENFPTRFGQPEVFMDGLTRPARMHLRDGYLYFTEMGVTDGTSSRLARRDPSGTVQTLFTGQAVVALYMDDDELFFTERGVKKVYRMKYTTLTPELFTTTPLMVADIARIGDEIWMTLFDTATRETGILKRNRVTGAETTPQITMPGFVLTYTMAAGNILYVSSLRLTGDGMSMGLFKLTGDALGAVSVSGIRPQFLAVNATHVYFGDENQGVILRQAHSATMQPETVATGQPSPYGMWVDAGGVYWTNGGSCNEPPVSDGSVRAVPVAGGTSVSIAENEPCPQYIFADSNWVYWARHPYADTPGSSSIMRAAKMR